MSIKTTRTNTKTIAIFSANYLPHIGGIETFTYHLSQTLEAMNYHTIIVTNDVFNLTSHEFLESGVEIYRLPCHPLLKGRLPLPQKNKEFKRLLRTIESQQIDYVLINARFYPLSLIAAKLAQKKEITPIIIDHGSNYITLGNPFIDSIIKIYEHIITAALKKYPGDFYGISQASLKWLTTFHIIGKNVITNSIDAETYLQQISKRNFREEFRLSDKDFIVCFTGRLVPEKGILPLLKTAELFSVSEPTIHFIFAGDGPLMQLIKNKSLSNTHLTGALNSSDIAALLKQSNAFCLPTRSEGFSTSLLEAAACYTTPIITNVGGAKELIPSSNFGIILTSTNPNEIYNAIKKLFDNPDQNIKMAKNIGELVRNDFSWDITAKKVLQACINAND